MGWKLGDRVRVSRFNQKFTGSLTGIFTEPGKAPRLAVQADGSHPWCSLLLSERFVSKTKDRQNTSPEALQRMGYYGPIASGRKKAPDYSGPFPGYGVRFVT